MPLVATIQENQNGDSRGLQADGLAVRHVLCAEVIEAAGGTGTIACAPVGAAGWIRSSDITAGTMATVGAQQIQVSDTIYLTCDASRYVVTEVTYVADGQYVSTAVTGYYPTATADITGSAWAPCFCRPPSKAELFRSRIKKQLACEAVGRGNDLWIVKRTVEENRARRFLKRLIGERDFERYLRRGFIMVKGRSGTLYKVSGGHVRVVSYVKQASGKFEPHETFCVVFKDADLPFTDGVIMRKLIIENDEFALRKLANVSPAWRTNLVGNGQYLVPLEQFAGVANPLGQFAGVANARIGVA